MRLYLPGTKFARNGVIKYENGGNNHKFFDYHVLVYAYSNFQSSLAVTYNVESVADYVKTMYFTGA